MDEKAMLISKIESFISEYHDAVEVMLDEVEMLQKENAKSLNCSIEDLQAAKERTIRMTSLLESSIEALSICDDLKQTIEK